MMLQNARLVARLAALTALAAGPFAPASAETPSAKVETIRPLHALVLPMTGPHSQHDEAFARLAAHLRSLGAVPVGPPFGRYFNDPKQVPEANLRWEVGLPVGPGVEAPAPFEVKDIPGGETAILVHEGPYESSGTAWPVLLDWLARRGYRPVGPAMQLYLGDPSRAGAEGPRTELRLPVRRVTSSAASPAADAPPAGAMTPSDSRWAASEDLRITIHSPDEPPQVLTSGHMDFKPSWSPDGSKLTFFRLMVSGAEFKDWRTKLCVINADGTGFRELTSGQYPDFNPTWTRDGSMRILFNRYSTEGGWRNKIYWTTATASPGEEELISDPDYPDFEWVTGALKDGRLLVDRVSATSALTFLLTPRPGRAGRYQRIARPTDRVWHKLTLSPSERRVAYMLDHDRNGATYEDVVLCYADFDAATLTISNQVAITESDSHSIDEYPAWSRDESVILYDANALGRYQIFAYHLADGTTSRVSPRTDRDYQFVALEGLPR
jgi:AraC family transcriptional regulator